MSNFSSVSWVICQHRVLLGKRVLSWKLVPESSVFLVLAMSDRAIAPTVPLIWKKANACLRGSWGLTLTSSLRGCYSKPWPHWSWFYLFSGAAKRQGQCHTMRDAQTERRSTWTRAAGQGLRAIGFSSSSQRHPIYAANSSLHFSGPCFIPDL